MPKARLDELRKMEPYQLEERVRDMRVELSKLRAEIERAAVKKRVGKIRPMRRNIARYLTVLREKERQQGQS